MNIEIEERVLEVNIDDIIKNLEELKAIKKGEWHQRRYVYDFNPKRENEWIRLRHNGEKSTLTYKNIENNSISGTKELEIEVSNFEETNQMLNILGYKSKAYQENKRIRYILDNVEIDIDSWPLIPTYVEVEGSSESEVLETLTLLNIDGNVTTLDVESIYREIYGIDILSIEELKF